MARSILDFSVAFDDVVASAGAEPSLRELIFGYYRDNIDDKQKALQYARDYCQQIEDKEAICAIELIERTEKIMTGGRNED